MDYEAFIKAEQEKQIPFKERLEKRVKLLDECANDDIFRSEVYEMCKRDPIFWINNFCYTFDPRISADIPVILYDYQEFMIKEIIQAIEEGEDILIEKSRDMGATWSIIWVFQHYWLFKGNCAFLMGSQKEADVDDAVKDNPVHLFGKFRYNFNRLPKWMQPKNVTNVALSMFNVDNNSTIDGSSCTSNFGRSRRYTAILMDELPQWAIAGEKAWNQTAQTTNTRINLGTPEPTATWHCKLMTEYNVNIRDVPYKHSKGLAAYRGVEG